MANGRLFIRCSCGEVRKLANWWGWSFDVLPAGVNPLQDWLEEHQSCGQGVEPSGMMPMPWTLISEHSLSVEERAVSDPPQEKPSLGHGTGRLH